MSNATLKTYRAATMAEALAEVKKDLGKEAVILRTRSLKSGGFLGFGAKPCVEITASVDHAPTTAPARAPSTVHAATVRSALPPLHPAPVPPARSPAVLPGPATPRGPRLDPIPFATTPQPPMGDPVHPPKLAIPEVATLVKAIRATMPPAPRAQGVLADTVSASPPALTLIPAPTSPSLATRVALAPVDTPARLIVEDELVTIKRLVNQVLQTSRSAASSAAARPPHASAAVLNLGPMSEPLFANYMRLIDGGVASDLAEEIATRTKSDLHPEQLNAAADVRHAMLKNLAQELRCVAPIDPLPTTDGRPLTIALIGPTGVGKTTTVAKLAAMYKIKHGLRVGLVTCDTYRIAAVEQLRTYAGILGLPLKIGMAPRDIAPACRDFAQCDVVLIDTAGRSQHDGTRLSELASYIAEAQPHQTHLAVSLTVAESVALKIAERFSVLKPDRAILTKLDEAVQFGPVLNLARRTGLRFSFLTTGQEVPDHIQPASPERLARVVLDGEMPAHEG